MGWESSRPVPYRRLLREWLIFAPILVAALWLMQGDGSGFGAILVGVAASLPLYLGLGVVLAKFGYQRRSLADMRTPRASNATTDSSPSGTRPKPAPTRRTAGGTVQRSQKRR